ncbi:hypothetical protein ccbrp13_23950 [Ktedonobacteria bacterium brp13]|nr:hypothetical protein ccbrp13_23950 [Ktedonobacteria bacterium brp13]
MNLALAAGITISVGQNTWSIGWGLIMYLVIALIVGVIAEFIVGWRVPFGIVGAIIAGIIGVWLMTKVLNVQIDGLNDPVLYGVPLIHGLIGSIILIAIWHLLTGGGRRPRRRRERGYRERGYRERAY